MTKTKEVVIYFDGMPKKGIPRIDVNGEILIECQDGRFVKFPNVDNLDELIEIHNKANNNPPT